MANPYPIELRERAVRAYEPGGASYATVADRFSVNLWTLLRWVQRRRATGTVAALGKRGGWSSPVVLTVLHAVVRETPDATTEDLTRVYNRRVPRAHRVHRSSVLRALRRTGYVFKKKRPRPAEQDRPEVQAKREAFRQWAAQVDPARLVFVDESGANLAMGRSHAWVPRETVMVDPRPMNWGNNLTMIRRDPGGSVADAANRLADRQCDPLRHLGRAATRPETAARGHRGPRQSRSAQRSASPPAHRTARRNGALSAPYSPDLNPIEAAWGLIKKRIRPVAPRSGRALRRTAQQAWRVVRPRHCQSWYAHAGYCWQLN